MYLFNSPLHSQKKETPLRPVVHYLQASSRALVGYFGSTALRLSLLLGHSQLRACLAGLLAAGVVASAAPAAPSPPITDQCQQNIPSSASYTTQRFPSCWLCYSRE